MTIPADKSSGVAEPVRNIHGGPADANQTSLASLATYAVDVVRLCGHLYGQLGVLGQKVHVLEEQVDRLSTTVGQQSRRHDEHVAILAACQKDTANALNHQVERHALHPAVEAAVALTEELSRLQDCAKQLPGSDEGNDGLGEIRTEIDISCTVAHEKLAHLGVQRIAPTEGEQFDMKLHSVCGCVETIDEELQGKISKLVTAGIVYRRKVLRQARVSVFRMRTSDGQDKRKESI
jgi:molecular chaperone GrpE (heat shock protein)